MHQALLVGLPASGKTTFLAAFWNVIVRTGCRWCARARSSGCARGPPERPDGSLATVRSGQPNEYRRRANCRRSESNPVTGNPSLRSSCPTSLVNQSSEALRIANGRLAFRDYVHDSTGVLLFVHPKEISEPWPILDAMEIAGAEASPSPESGMTDASAKSEWSANQVPTDVQLVDLLQLLCAEIATERFRLAVIVSAWDLVDEQGAPSEWLAKELPLVDQF